MLAHALDTDRRSAMRHPVDYPVLAARTGREDVRLRIVNISPTGFMANGSPGLGIGDRLVVRLPVIGEIEVQLMWSDAMRAGFNFERLIRIGDFTRMFVEMQPRRSERS